MEILKFNKINGNQYKEFIKKYNNVQEFDILNSQTFNVGEKEIFLVVEKGILNKNKILAYSIIQKDIEYSYIINSADKDYFNNETTICILDFMVREKSRNKGVGTKLAKYLMDYIYIDKDIILEPKGDGYWFWKKFNFEENKELQKTVWKRKNNRR